jgi:hypothetical protein
MAGEMNLGALWQKTFAPTLPAPRESSAATLGLHARAESVLTFPGAL